MFFVNAAIIPKMSSLSSGIWSGAFKNAKHSAQLSNASETFGIKGCLVLVECFQVQNMPLTSHCPVVT